MSTFLNLVLSKLLIENSQKKQKILLYLYMPETASIEKSAPFAVFSIRVETIEIYKNTLQLKLSKAFENISFGVDLLDLFELRNKWL